jgi:hypothetical protein
MILALRHSLPPGASLVQRASSAVIEARLVTQFAHAGIVIGGTLHHATGADGVHAEPGADLSGYTLIDLGGEHDARALALFAEHAGSGYDWFSLLAFALFPARDSRRWYCYEWAYHCMTGKHPTRRVTPETLLRLAHDMRTA